MENRENRINIEGIDKASLLIELWKFQILPKGSLVEKLFNATFVKGQFPSRRQAEEAISNGKIDYFFLKKIGCDLSGNEVDPIIYDLNANQSGLFESIVQELRRIKSVIFKIKTYTLNDTNFHNEYNCHATIRVYTCNSAVNIIGTHGITQTTKLEVGHHFNSKKSAIEHLLVFRKYLNDLRPVCSEIPQKIEIMKLRKTYNFKVKYITANCVSIESMISLFHNHCNTENIKIWNDEYDLNHYIWEKFYTGKKELWE